MDSALHVIVLDELDAFCRERATLRGDTSGVRDSVVNQLLAKVPRHQSRRHHRGVHSQPDSSRLDSHRPFAA